MKKIVLLVFLELLLLTLAAAAQTISPPISEFHSKVAKGQFTVTNNGLTPLDVKIEPLSFSVDATGTAHFRPLDASTHLKMDSFTGRVGVKQQRTFFYEVRCDQYPCFLSIYSVMTVGRTPEGIAVAIHLPSTIYLCEREKKCREHVRRDLWGLK
jgi:hypothetical protein